MNVSNPEMFENMPPRMRLYGEALNATTRAIEKYYEIDLAEAEHQEHRGPSMVQIVDFFRPREKPTSLELPSVGSDSALMSHLRFSNGVSDQEHTPKVVGNHRGIVMAIDLFADGSPYVADGDNMEIGNVYEIVMSREGLPFIAQQNDTVLDTDNWNTYENKRQLTDLECERLIEFVNQTSENPLSICGTLVDPDLLQ